MKKTVTSKMIANDLEWCIAHNDDFVIKSETPAEQIAVFKNSIFFNWEDELTKCADAVRLVLKAEKKRRFVIASRSTYLSEDMMHVLETGLARIADHAILLRRNASGKLVAEGAAVVFELI